MQRRPAPSHARQLSPAVEQREIDLPGVAVVQADDIGVLIIAAKPFTEWKSVRVNGGHGGHGAL